MESDGGKPFYMACRDGRGSLVAICPFFYGKAGRHLLELDSLPMGHMTGPLIGAEAGNTAELLESLRRSVKFSALNPLVSMKLRVHQEPVARCLVGLGFECERDSGLFVLDLLKKTPADILGQEFRKHERGDIRYYEEGGSSFELASQESDYNAFLSMQQESMRRQGYLPLSPELLSSLRSNFGEGFKVASVVSGNERIAALGFFCDPTNSMVNLMFVGYSRARNSKSSYFFAFWKLVNWASETGFRYLDFGLTSPDPADPRHRVKRKFGGEWVERYAVSMPIQSRFVLPIYRRSRSFAGSVKRAMPGFGR